MKISKQGDVEIMMIEDLGGLSNEKDRLCWNIINTFGGPIHVMLSGDRDIFLKLWPVKNVKENWPKFDQPVEPLEGSKPTIINTGLKWATFNQDGNILILVKTHYMGTTVFISKKDSKTIYFSDALKKLRTEAVEK